MDEWVRTHHEEVPRDTRAFCGDVFAGKHMLDVGCGEMLSAFGLLDLRLASLMGIDIDPRPADWKAQIAGRIERNGHALAPDWDRRMDYIQYDGENFPLADRSIDIAFSWSAFEHIDNPRVVLREMHRVLRDDGFAFVQVYPWYRSRAGSHVDSFIEQPFFHLSQTDRWVERRLLDYIDAHPEADRDFVSVYLAKEYRRLNRISVNEFYRCVRDSGFAVTKSRLIVYDEDLSGAPDGTDFSDLMIRGTMMMLRKAGPFRTLSRDEQL